ncbi:hypothetical protein ACIBCN_27035 [Nocardia sp. NPDC051052]|uniref:hypothetical protein n=1 Tax=Nocardia sp. NPDC051052 TaxID=3364322 RepID=UPI00379871C4
MNHASKPGATAASHCIRRPGTLGTTEALPQAAPTSRAWAAALAVIGADEQHGRQR